MAGREFLHVARDAAAGSTDYHRRAAFVHAYYALFLECRDTLDRWGFSLPKKDSVHAWVRLKFAYSKSPELRLIGDALDKMVKNRNHANYDLRPHTKFTTNAPARVAIQLAQTTLSALDQIDADSARRAAAIAAISAKP